MKSDDSQTIIDDIHHAISQYEMSEVVELLKDLGSLLPENRGDTSLLSSRGIKKSLSSNTTEPIFASLRYIEEHFWTSTKPNQRDLCNRIKYPYVYRSRDSHCRIRSY